MKKIFKDFYIVISACILSIILAMSISQNVYAEEKIDAPEYNENYNNDISKASPKNFYAPVKGTDYYDFANEVLKLVNAERKKAGVKELVLDTNMTELAMVRSHELIKSFSHTRTNGKLCFEIFEDIDDWNVVGENIAAGQISPQEVMDSWMNSDGHMKNILNPKFTRMGVGICYSKQGKYKYYWTQVFADGTTKNKGVKNKHVNFKSYVECSSKEVAKTSNCLNYKNIFNKSFYYNRYSDVSKKYYSTDAGSIFNDFIKYGMKKGRIGCKNFDVNFYRNNNPDLKKRYGKDLKKYYLHYNDKGKKLGRKGSRGDGTYDKVTIYKNIDYKLVYDYDYFVKLYPIVADKYGNDDYKTLEYFVNKGMSAGMQGCATFNVFIYKERYIDLRKKYGDDLKKYYIHYIKYGYKKGRKGI